MIEDRFMLDSVPEEYRRLLYEYWNDNATNSETVMDGPTWLAFYQQHIERKG